MRRDSWGKWVLNDLYVPPVVSSSMHKHQLGP